MAESLVPRRVVVTGVGIVSPIGIGRIAFWQALCAGESGIRAHGDAVRLPHRKALMATYDAREFVASAHLRRMDKLSRALVSSARMALADAGLNANSVDPTRVGVVVGSALGNISESVQYLQRVFTKGPALASPMVFPNLVLNAPASYTAMEVGCTGANLTVSHGEVSGEQAFALGCDLIRSGRADVVLAGGGDECDEILIDAYRRFHALSAQRGGAEWCSPYDLERNGVILGEGAAMLVLESADLAAQRGATRYAEVEASASFGIAAPLFDWPAQAPAAVDHVRRVLASPRGNAGTDPTHARVDVVYGSANSSRRLDGCEIDLLAQVFGETAGSVIVTSIKGAIGEFGAAGALTAAAACLALASGYVSPLCHLRRPPSDVLLQFAPTVARPQLLRRALMMSLARGGAGLAFLLRAPSVS